MSGSPDFITINFEANEIYQTVNKVQALQPIILNFVSS